MKKQMHRIIAAAGALCMTTVMSGAFAGEVKAANEKVILRVCNWEEYVDLGEWDEEEVIDLESGDIFGENSLIEDFEEWYLETYGVEVEVEYSTFGTNEELYSQLTLGDVYDLVCPSDYMIMKLMSENKVVPFTEDFFDENDEYNYYVKGVSPYINDVFWSNEINGEAWGKYAAGYMWGTTGFVYNADEVAGEDVKTWDLLTNSDYFRQVTVKDNVRDAYFPTLAILNKDKLLNESFINSENYSEELSALMNDTSDGTIERAEAKLKEIRANVYAFETDSGKADMVSGKILASLQWSGDAVYAMDQAEEDDVYLYWEVPDECTNLWFDGWVMLKAGVDGDEAKQKAAQAFINFLSRPDNVVRNMYYIGYTSSISAAEDGRVYEYVEWLYGAEDDEEEPAEYPLGYFFTGNEDDEDYVLFTSEEQTHRQLYAQYPTAEVIERSAPMNYYPEDINAKINQMWINIRCFNLSQISTQGWIIMGIVAVIIIGLCFFGASWRKIFIKKAN